MSALRHLKEIIGDNAGWVIADESDEWNAEADHSCGASIQIAQASDVLWTCYCTHTRRNGMRARSTSASMHGSLRTVVRDALRKVHCPALAALYEEEG